MDQLHCSCAEARWKSMPKSESKGPEQSHQKKPMVHKEGKCAVQIFGFFRSLSSNLEGQKIWDMFLYLRKYKCLVKEVYLIKCKKLYRCLNGSIWFLIFKIQVRPHLSWAASKLGHTKLLFVANLWYFPLFLFCTNKKVDTQRNLCLYQCVKYLANKSSEAVWSWLSVSSYFSERCESAFCYFHVFLWRLFDIEIFQRTIPKWFKS